MVKMWMPHKHWAVRYVRYVRYVLRAHEDSFFIGIESKKSLMCTRALDAAHAAQPSAGAGFNPHGMPYSIPHIPHS